MRFCFEEMVLSPAFNSFGVCPRGGGQSSGSAASDSRHFSYCIGLFHRIDTVRNLSAEAQYHVQRFGEMGQNYPATKLLGLKFRKLT